MKLKRPQIQSSQRLLIVEVVKGKINTSSVCLWREIAVDGIEKQAGLLGNLVLTLNGSLRLYFGTEVLLR